MAGREAQPPWRRNRIGLLYIVTVRHNGREDSCVEWLFIVNPVAGRGRTGRLWPEIEKTIRSRGIPMQVALTTAPGEATGIAREAADRAVVAIIGVGGDGTTGEIANGVLSSRHPETQVGVIPTGTGNDFVRGQGIPLSYEYSLEAILKGCPALPVDLVEVEDAAKNRRYAVNSVGIGFDAYVAHMAHSRRWLKRLGPLAYAFGAVGALITFRTTDARVLIDGQTAHSDGTWLAACTNTERLAGGMQICPGADCHDGKLNLCLVSGIPPLRVLQLMVLSFKGKHAGQPGVHLLSGQEVLVSAERPLPVHIDGDPVPFQLPLTLRVHAGAIRLLTPPPVKGKEGRAGDR